MSLAGLLSALERDTETRIAAELAAAEAEAAALLEETTRRLARCREAALREADEASERERQGALARTAREVRREVMESREAAIRRILGRLRQLVADPGAAGAPGAALARLASAALEYVPGEPSAIRASPAALGSLRDHLPAAGHRFIPDPALGAGVIVTTEDSRVTVDATLDGWLSAREPEVRMHIVRLLEQA